MVNKWHFFTYFTDDIAIPNGEEAASNTGGKLRTIDEDTDPSSLSKTLLKQDSKFKLTKSGLFSRKTDDKKNKKEGDSSPRQCSEANDHVQVSVIKNGSRSVVDNVEMGPISKKHSMQEDHHPEEKSSSGNLIGKFRSSVTSIGKGDRDSRRHTRTSSTSSIPAESTDL